MGALRVRFMKLERRRKGKLTAENQEFKKQEPRSKKAAGAAASGRGGYNGAWINSRRIY
jgi:hypothetical protein